MEPFRQDNTEGYADAELLEINAEWWGIADDMQLEQYTPEYEDARKQFCDEVSRR